MKLIQVLFMTALVLIFVNSSNAANKAKNKVAKSSAISKKSCAKVDKKIATLNSRLRAGYSLKQGEKMKDKLRALDKQKYGCSRKRYPTK